VTRRVVVVGYGMAGARLAEEVRRRDPAGAAVALTVLGAEPYAAYNRVLLSSVLAGGLDAEAVRLHEPGWAARHGVDVRTGVRVVGIDTGARRVVCDDGDPCTEDWCISSSGQCESRAITHDEDGDVLGAGAGGNEPRLGRHELRLGRVGLYDLYRRRRGGRGAGCLGRGAASVGGLYAGRKAGPA